MRGHSIIAGVEAEAVTVKSTVTMPLPDGLPLPPGMSNAVTTTTDLWIAHRFDAYASSAMPIPGLMGTSGLTSQGFVMRAIERSSSMRDVEFETVVTKITEETAPAGVFEIPADYQEVPAASSLESLPPPRH